MSKGSRIFRRKIDTVFDRLRVSPLGVLVFLVSVAVLMVLESSASWRLEAPAVGHAVVSHHPSPTSTVVQDAHVHPGDEVDEGAPLVTLSPRFLERELELIDAEIRRVMTEARFERAEVALREEERTASASVAVAKARRDLLRARALGDRQKALAAAAQEQLREVTGRVESGVTSVDDELQAQWVLEAQRTSTKEAQTVAQAERILLGALEKNIGASGGDSTLVEPIKEAHKARLEVLLVRRSTVVGDLNALTVFAQASGRVVEVLRPGSAVARDTSVASVLPDRATEMVAYLPPEKSVLTVALGTEVRVTRVCPGNARVVRVGASVEQAPGQLNTLIGTPMFGTPLYLSIPENCTLGVGQVLSVELDSSGL